MVDATVVTWACCRQWLRTQMHQQRDHSAKACATEMHPVEPMISALENTVGVTAAIFLPIIRTELTNAGSLELRAI